MARTVPVAANESVGAFLQSATWNASVQAAVAFLTTPPVAVLEQTVSQSIASGSAGAAITFDTTVQDTDSGHSNTTNPSRYTAQVAGWYLVIGSIVYATNGTGSRKALVYKNGVLLPYAVIQGTAVATSGDATGVGVAAVVVMNGSGDYVEIWGAQDSGSAVSTTPNSTNQCGMSVYWLHS